MPRRPVLLWSVAIATATVTGFAPVRARDLSLEERVRAQGAIERVYYAHQIGATEPFERAVPRSLLTDNVRLYLKKSVALERIWKTPISGAMLRAEMDRMIRRTRMPDRLREIFTALGDDPVLIQECLARPALVDRLIRGFQASDHPGQTWDTWWSGIEAGLDDTQVRVSALEGQPPPEVGGPEVPQPESGVPDDVWDNGALDDLPDPRENPTAVWTGSEMLVWGGRNNDITLDTGGRYDPATDTWSSITRLNAPAPRYAHTAVWTGRRMVVWGGLTVAGGAPTDTGGSYDPLLDIWTPTTMVGAPSARSRHTAVWSGSEMLVWGGESAGGPGGRYDPEADSWKPISATNAPSERSAHTAVWADGIMIVWGGDSNAFPLAFLDTGGRYDPVTDTWVATATATAPEARADHTAVWTGSRMIVWGGVAREGDSFPRLNTGALYDPVTNIWSQTPTTNAPSPRDGHTAVWTGGKMIVWGDTAGSSTSLPGTGGSYDPVANSWTATSTAGAPSGRSAHAAVWTGSQMIVWGGATFSGVSNLGGRYDPLADAWTPTARGTAPPARQDHTAVWTGSLMIVWGGSDYVRPMDGGGRYDPAIHDWSPTSSVGAPPARSSHTAVWTGGRMIVWGGIGTSSFGENTGGLYDPIADTWTPTSLAGAPSPRHSHTAIWTGSALVIWGGQIYDPTTFSQVYLSSGGRYDPAGDVWTPTSLSGAPTGRSLHTAVWTGSRMIVWGGAGGSFENTGAVYDPVADRWTPTAMAGSPVARFEHEGVWTGTRMLIWGGMGVTGLLKSGGQYDPIGDAWSPVSTPGAPTPGRYPSSVWTGDRMVIWGGWIHSDTSGDLMLDTGGRYDPVGDLWSPTTTAGAPSGRRRHTAVWAGSQMIVWGGANGALAVLDSGGSYGRCAAATFYRDADGDGFGDTGQSIVACVAPPGYAVTGGDCDDSDAGAWMPPGEATGLLFTDGTTLVWAAPAQSGATTLLYDLIRSHDPADFVSASACVAADSPMPIATDTSLPAPARSFFYLVRAQNGCPSGEGPLGNRSDGSPRTARSCP